MPLARRIVDVVFDLDGTLVDSRPGIDWSAGQAVAQVWPGRAARSLAPLIGPPISEMLALAYPQASPVELEALARAFRRTYDGAGWRHTRPWPGVHDLLVDLSRAGAELFVVTNKPASPTALILDELGLGKRFADVVSPDSSAPPFGSKADALVDLDCRYPGLRNRSVYVGDAPDDRAAARLAGFPFVAAAYGYGDIRDSPSPTDLGVIEHPSHLAALVITPPEP